MERLEFANTISLGGGVAAASQSCLVDARATRLTTGELATLGAGYLRFLDGLPALAVANGPEGAVVGPWGAPRRLALLRFGPPYLAAARGGRELRYPIAGGLMARRAGGYLAFGVGPEGRLARLWVDVVGFAPLLGLGTLYLLTQVQLHRLITSAYLRRVARRWAT